MASKNSSTVSFGCEATSIHTIRRAEFNGKIHRRDAWSNERVPRIVPNGPGWRPSGSLGRWNRIRSPYRLSGHLVQEIPQTHGAFEPSHTRLSSDSRSTWRLIQHDNPIRRAF